jgi:hypothetical protein
MVLDPQMPPLPTADRVPLLKIAIVLGNNTLSIEGPFTVPEAVTVITTFVGAVSPSLPADALPALTSKLMAATTALEHSVAAAPR